MNSKKFSQLMTGMINKIKFIQLSVVAYLQYAAYSIQVKQKTEYLLEGLTEYFHNRNNIFQQTNKQTNERTNGAISHKERLNVEYFSWTIFNFLYAPRSHDNCHHYEKYNYAPRGSALMLKLIIYVHGQWAFNHFTVKMRQLFMEIFERLS